MKILRMVYDWPEPWIGLAPAPYYLSKAQGELGHEVYVLCGNLNLKRLLQLKFIERPEKNVTVYNLPRALTSSTGPFLTTAPIALLYYFYFRFIKKIDLVHGHGHMCLCFNLYKYLFGWLDKIKYVAHFHNNSIARAEKAIENNEHLSKMQTYFEFPLHALSDNLAIKVADQIITVSAQNKNEFIEINGANEDKITVVESGVPIEKLQSLKQIPRKSNILRLGASGVISDRKGILELLDALALLNELDFTFSWIGGFRDKEFEDKVYKKIESNGLKDKFIITGMVSNDSVFDYLTHLDFFIFPSKYEGLPKSVIEALAIGIPSLVSGFNFSTDIDGVEYIGSLDSNELAKQINRFVNASYKVEREQIFNNFSWTSRAKLVENIYNKIK